MKEDIIIIGYRHDGRNVGKPYGAYAKNRLTGKTFYLGSYSSINSRERLSKRLLSNKMKNPSEQFKRFLNGK